MLKVEAEDAAATCEPHVETDGRSARPLARDSVKG